MFRAFVLMQDVSFTRDLETITWCIPKLCFLDSLIMLIW